MTFTFLSRPRWRLENGDRTVPEGYAALTLTTFAKLSGDR